MEDSNISDVAFVNSLKIFFSFNGEEEGNDNFHNKLYS